MFLSKLLLEKYSAVGTQIFQFLRFVPGRKSMFNNERGQCANRHCRHFSRNASFASACLRMALEFGLGRGSRQVPNNRQVVDNALASCQLCRQDGCCKTLVVAAPCVAQMLGTNVRCSNCVDELEKIARQNHCRVTRTAFGKTRRGSCKISKRNLKQLRREEGSKGGQQIAGNGSRLVDIRKKERNMFNYFKKTGQVPSKRFAAKEWGMSQSVRTRAAKLCV